MNNPTTTQPFPFLSAADLQGLAAFFAAEPAAKSVNIDLLLDGSVAVVTERDLRFIHDLDASRFGGRIEDCPYCAND